MAACGELLPFPIPMVRMLHRYSHTGQGAGHHDKGSTMDHPHYDALVSAAEESEQIRQIILLTGGNHDTARAEAWATFKAEFDKRT